MGWWNEGEVRGLRKFVINCSSSSQSVRPWCPFSPDVPVVLATDGLVRWGVQEEWGWLFLSSVLLLICLTQVFHASVLCDPLALRLALGAWWVGRMRGIRRGRCSFLPLLVCLLCASSSEPCKVPSLCRKLAAGKGSDGVRLNQSVELNRCITEFNFH